MTDPHFRRFHQCWFLCCPEYAVRCDPEPQHMLLWMAVHNAHHQHTSAILWIFPPIRKLCCGSFCYRYTEISLKLSNFLISGHISLFVFGAFRQGSNNVKCVVPKGLWNNRGSNVYVRHLWQYCHRHFLRWTKIVVTFWRSLIHRSISQI
jgi:hypothetical protein